MNNVNFLETYSALKKRCFISIFYDLSFSITSLIGFLVYHLNVLNVDSTNFGFIILSLLLRLATPVLLYSSLFRNNLLFAKLYFLCLSFSALCFACLSVSSTITLTTLFDDKQSMYVRHVRGTALPFLSVIIPGGGRGFHTPQRGGRGGGGGGGFNRSGGPGSAPGRFNRGGGAYIKLR
uniref:Uncharacterized protein n=1 Tax=Romanomermis culicivorax TaxID=13658 RepID=A0A915KVZ8_ROMCU